MLKDILKNELSDSKPARLGRDLVDSALREVSSLIDWCLSNSLIEACVREFEMVNNVAEKLANVRLGKALEADPASLDPASVDSELLGKVLTIVRKYERLVLTGLVNSEGYVPVVVTSDGLRLNNHHYSKGAVTTLKCSLALLMEAAGLVKVVEA
ncbi:MAG: hypothetical protein QXX81_01185 [Zestosphaera sp.]